MIRKQSAEEKTIESHHKASRRYLALGMVLLLCFSWFYMERRAEHNEQVRLMGALEEGEGVGGRVLTKEEQDYKFYRGKALSLLLPLSVLFLGCSGIRKAEARKLERELERAA